MMATNNMRGFSGTNMMLMRNESSQTDTLVAMLASCSPVALQVSRSVGGLEDAVVGCGQKRSFYPAFDPSGEEGGDEDAADDCTHNVEKKRRLTFDQVRSLERNFELENKLEPERKMLLAKELGLQPRQVAVWFQNRRARWKTKQLERDYEVLTVDYNRLKADFDAVLQEKERLKAEVQRLAGKLQGEEITPELEAVEPSVSGKSETTTHPSQKQAEVSMKSDRVQADLDTNKDSQSRASPTVDVSSNLKEKEQSASSDSNSESEILDADSPRTIDSANLPLMTIGKMVDCSQFSTDNFVDHNLLHVAEELCGRDLSSPLYQRTVKHEVGTFQEEPCAYFLPQLDEQGVMPWWDWA